MFHVEQRVSLRLEYPERLPTWMFHVKHSEWPQEILS